MWKSLGWALALAPGLWLWLLVLGSTGAGGGLEDGDAKLCSGERENGKWDR
jgi:hypothetical protein